MRRPPAVLFDLDGTLLDTLEDLASSGNEILSRRGLPVHPVEAYRFFIGDGMAQLVRRIFPGEQRPDEGEETELVLEEYRAAYAERWRNTTRPFPGIPALLDSLKERGVPIGVFSNKAHDFTVKCVEEFLPAWKWNIVLGAREHVPRKPDPHGALEAAREMGTDPEACLFVGDSNVDMMTARNASMQAIGVSWGFRPVEELKDAGAQTIIDHPSELVGILDRIDP